MVRSDRPSEPATNRTVSPAARRRPISAIQSLIRPLSSGAGWQATCRRGPAGPTPTSSCDSVVAPSNRAAMAGQSIASSAGGGAPFADPCAS